MEDKQKVLKAVHVVANGEQRTFWGMNMTWKWASETLQIIGMEGLYYEYLRQNVISVGYCKVPEEATKKPEKVEPKRKKRFGIF